MDLHSDTDDLHELLSWVISTFSNIAKSIADLVLDMSNRDRLWDISITDLIKISNDYNLL